MSDNDTKPNLPYIVTQFESDAISNLNCPSIEQTIEHLERIRTTSSNDPIESITPEVRSEPGYSLTELKQICDTQVLREYEKLQQHLKRFLAEATVSEYSYKQRIDKANKEINSKEQQLVSAHQVILELRIRIRQLEDQLDELQDQNSQLAHNQVLYKARWEEAQEALQELVGQEFYNLRLN